MGTLFNSNNQTTVNRLLLVYYFFTVCPNGLIRSGIWTNPTWDRSTFQQWFYKCLDEKINRDMDHTGRKRTPEYQNALKLDRKHIHDYLNHRIRNTGSRNILHTPEMQRRYPYINTQERE